ncbi:MAG: hypothetical protein IJB92_03705 [Clostridia bacterium]|nr:hypothetical protein [Clostridia bacterium]
MLYPKNQTPQLDAALFKKPTSEYRGTPFWAWNNKLDKDQLEREIEYMKEMGLGGFHMHSRTGMATHYLSDEFMSMVKACVEKARKEEMRAWLYDEDRWPSGAAGGIVTADEKYRSRYIVFTPYSDEDVKTGKVTIEQATNSRATNSRSGNDTLIASYDVELDENGCLKSYKLLKDGEKAQHKAWYAYLTIAGPNPWYNNQCYLNTLDPKSVEKFVEVTHERYKEVVGDDFGGIIPAIFTDEPQFARKSTLGFADEEKEIGLPWTDDLPKTYAEAYDGADVMATFPELIWNLPDNKPSLARYRYHDHISERFAGAFADTIGSWCKKNNIMLTGHMMEEPTLESQTAALGEAMRSYRSFGLPGIDILCDRREYTTAKQAQSAAHQYGYPGVLSELYGVTNWDFDFRGHKLQGDWQAAMGITVRVHHLTWVSMNGEAKRDYPASIGYQSPWYKEYPIVEDHFARVNTALTRGKPVVKVGVVHPVESYWLQWGPREQTAEMREEMDRHFADVTHWLLFGQMDFNYISESLLPTQCEVGGAPLKVGQMAYDAIIVPDMRTIRKTTFDRLQAFKKAGGKLIIMGNAPTLMDAVESEEVKQLAQGANVISFAKGALMSALEDDRLVDIRKGGASAGAGSRCDDFIYQMRQDGDSRWLFVCHNDRPSQLDVLPDEHIQIRLRGQWKPTLYNTMNGEITPMGARYVGGWTYIEFVVNACDSILLKLDEGKAEAQAPVEYTDRTGTPLRRIVPVTLSEPNVLVLDMAEHRLDDAKEWQAEEEILRLDDMYRKQLGFPIRMDAVPQPWVIPDEPIAHTLHVRYTFESDRDIEGALIAIEDAERVTVTLNGVKAEGSIKGYFVDECIKTMDLPKIVKGTNVMVVDMPFGKRTNPENCFILGDFGVDIKGVKRVLTSPVTELGFGDAAVQGLPHYAGNITYHLPIDGNSDIELGITHYKGALISVDVCGKRVGEIVYPPYRLKIRDIPSDAKTIDVTVFGNRVNAFGALHNVDSSVTWYGPNAWRSKGDGWAYEYNLRKFGILTSPTVRKI